MRTIPLTKGKKAIVDDEDWELVSKLKWHYQTVKKSGYACRKVWDKENKRYWTVYMHRFIMQPPKGLDIDHINRNPLDCRRKNMRICPRWVNIHNKPSSRPNTSGYRGVYKMGEKWIAFISFQGKRTYLGRDFTNPKDAAKAYDKAAREFYGKYAWQNLRGN